jgi:hypothetical protein
MKISNEMWVIIGLGVLAFWIWNRNPSAAGTIGAANPNAPVPGEHASVPMSGIL